MEMVFHQVKLAIRVRIWKVFEEKFETSELLGISFLPNSSLTAIQLELFQLIIWRVSFCLERRWLLSSVSSKRSKKETLQLILSQNFRIFWIQKSIAVRLNCLINSYNC